MKAKKLTFLWVMLLVVCQLSAQEEFFDDVYFSTKVQKKEQQTEQPTSQKRQAVDKSNETTIVTTARRVEQPAVAASSEVQNGRDVDEYNRRYSGVAVEEPYEEDETTVSTENRASQRRSDTEYTERIVRYHSPSKITIAGADQVDLYLSDGYYGYGYDTDYSDGRTNVNVSVNVGSPFSSWYSPWYSWYDPWFYSSWYSPWYYSYWYSPRWSWGWSWGGFYAGWYDPWYYNSWYAWHGPAYWSPGYWAVAIGDTIIIMPLLIATVKVDDLLTSVMEADEVPTVVIGPVTHVAIR